MFTSSPGRQSPPGTSTFTASLTCVGAHRHKFRGVPADSLLPPAEAVRACQTRALTRCHVPLHLGDLSVGPQPCWTTTPSSVPAHSVRGRSVSYVPFTHLLNDAQSSTSSLSVRSPYTNHLRQGDNAATMAPLSFDFIFSLLSYRSSVHSHLYACQCSIRVLRNKQ
jgi:hypothetical protein